MNELITFADGLIFFYKINRKRLTNNRKRCIIKSWKGGLIMTRKERKRLERDERRANVMMVIAILRFAIQLATFIITMTR